MNPKKVLVVIGVKVSNPRGVGQESIQADPSP